MLEIFLTGCDQSTEWQLPWFIDNYRKSNENPIYLADFGMSEEMRESMTQYFDYVFDVKSQAKGWFKKPQAILTATKLKNVSKVCWLDTDCEVMGTIDGIFDLSEQGRLGMVEDRPWSRRRSELGNWYNSGVVLVEGSPSILKSWADECVRDPVQGDQEVLYLMMEGDPIKKMTYISPLPHTYNTLRLDYLDGIAVKNPRIIHHTGKKGKDKIRELMDVE